MEPSSDKRPHVELFTDGACVGNPGPGGWAFILRHRASGREKEGVGGEQHTTNNRMEVTAAIRGLEALRGPSVVALCSDSQYLVKAIQGWLEKWKARGWRKRVRGGEKIKNADLWQKLDEVMVPHEVTATWVRGHAGHPENERCDVLADAEANKMAALPPLPVTPGVKEAAAALFDDEDDE